MQQSLFSIRATSIALFLYCVFGISVGVSNYIFPTGHFIDYFIPISSGLFIGILLLYFRKDPEARQVMAVKTLFFLTVYCFVTPAWYFTLGSELNDWVFVDEFPPISGVILIATAVLIVMVPNNWLRYMVVLWSSVCAPILIYLIAHPNELSTARGREMMVFFGPGGALFFIVLSYQRDIIIRFAKVEAHLKHSRRLADHDELTKTCNRRGLIYWLSKHAGDKPNISGLIIDIDHFKHINDTFGHEVGDSILKQVSRLLEDCVSSKGCLARWGGDEFVILIHDLPASQVEQLANQCLVAIREYDFPIVGQVTCSIGVGLNVESTAIDNIIREADNSLYRAKQIGRNQAVNNQP
ncbi:hypothetical protein C0J08_01100 [Marinomonas sp. CT5]|uniref:GGDEF domain-containing protein n=1 Tax=Marinomonas sp. CT5 TaxID=2066133 RepID=UPI001BB052E7|nr:GGDEF domain-containing protein [Marinomonas sp. CT5]QUX94082.1 hypothetical protein C0J08_01100 [Marinomonas sp. CT5]